ncbi:MAG: hypothetical protein ACM3X4_08425 [Ignavibacteriales bacterium]
MADHGNRRVFRGRLLADGMWVVHLLFGLWVAAGLGLGLWGCSYALRPGTPPATRTVLVVFGQAMALLIDIPFLIMWKDIARTVVLRPDALQMGKTLIPYEDMVSLGLSRGGQGDLVLASGSGSATGRARRDVSLPRWAGSHDGFLEELRQRAPQMILHREGLRSRAVAFFANSVFMLWCTMAAALLSAFYLPSWRASLPRLISQNLTGILVGGYVVCLVYIIAARRTTGRRGGR